MRIKVDFPDLLHIDDIGTMAADKAILWQGKFKLLQGVLICTGMCA